MAKLLILMSLLVSSVCLAAVPAMRLPQGARLVNNPELPRGEQGLAKLGCNLYDIAVENGKLGKTRLLTHAESAPFTFGQLVMFKADYPPPYENVSVAFNHFFIRYLETPEQKPMPYIQAFFMRENTGMKDMQFSLSKLGAGDRLMIRDAYLFSPQALLTFQCSLEIL